MMHPPPQTNAKQPPETDTAHLQTARETPQVSEESPAMVSVEDLETDDVVIAYVIQLSTVKSLTSCPEVSWVQQALERAR